MRQCSNDRPRRSRITGRVAAYVWGPDVGSSYAAGRSMQRAGGVGGLLMVLDGVSTGAGPNSTPDPTDDDYFPLMDRMGNVTGYKKASTTTPATQLDAIYEYDAFGQEIRSTGPAADVVPYHFSTKFTDATGLVYYGYRWYDAAKGRWLSRDPIGENGGVNLYGMVGNVAIGVFDYLGLDFHLIQVKNSDPVNREADNDISKYGPVLVQTRFSVESFKKLPRVASVAPVCLAEATLDANSTVQLFDGTGFSPEAAFEKLKEKISEVAKKAQTARDLCCQAITDQKAKAEVQKRSSKIVVAIHGNSATVHIGNGEYTQQKFNQNLEAYGKELKEKYPCVVLEVSACYNDGANQERVPATSGQSRDYIYTPGTLTIEKFEP